MSQLSLYFFFSGLLKLISFLLFQFKYHFLNLLSFSIAVYIKMTNRITFSVLTSGITFFWDSKVLVRVWSWDWLIFEGIPSATPFLLYVYLSIPQQPTKSKNSIQLFFYPISLWNPQTTWTGFLQGLNTKVILSRIKYTSCRCLSFRALLILSSASYLI